MNTHHTGGVDGRTAPPSPGASPRSDPDARFDDAMRALHAQAVEHVSPQIRARLRTIRSEAAAQPHRGRGGLLGWALASSAVAAFALAIGLQFSAGPSGAPSAPGVPSLAAHLPAPAERVYDPDTAVAALDENPDLYLWLASNTDALPPQTHTE